MASGTPLVITVEHIAVPRELPAFMQSLVGLSNNPASLYRSVNLQSLIVYVAPTSTVSVINLSRLYNALCQEDENALALKSVLETSTVVKVFFDARMPAKILFDRCAIRLANEV